MKRYTQEEKQFVADYLNVPVAYIDDDVMDTFSARWVLLSFHCQQLANAIHRAIQTNLPSFYRWFFLALKRINALAIKIAPQNMKLKQQVCSLEYAKKLKE